MAPGSPGTTGIVGSAIAMPVMGAGFRGLLVRHEAVDLAIVAQVEPDDLALVVDALRVDDVRSRGRIDRDV